MSREDVESQYKEDPSVIYSNTFFRKRKKGKNVKWQSGVAKFIVETYGINSIVDFGCALGYFLKGALDGGATIIKGFEYQFDNAKPYIPKELLPFISYGDVMEKIDCGKFDCAMSIEVAEHILPEKSEMFVYNLTQASNKYVFVTAAVPGQGGNGHINERPRDYWIKEFNNQGFSLCTEEVLKIRNGMSVLSKSGYKIPKYMNNHMFFIKD